MMTSPESPNLKDILKALGSTLRTKILSELATGDKYVLQLVRTLGKTQQDIHRNLNYLEKLGLVSSYTLSYRDYKTTSTKPSKGRRYFRINHSFILQINLSPAFFNLYFKSIPIEQFQFQNIENHMKTIDIQNLQTKSISELSREIRSENERLERLQEKQEGIFVKQTQLQNQIINQINQFDLVPLESVILTKLIGKQSISIEDLAFELNLHPNSCRSILESLSDHIPLKHTNNHWSL
ncbi:MAG: ArsR family transcriptional regulator [Candidatus Lokiarchaeota archaeon]|nr:ArsR family transcriptional regulator [Candidatus Lokiarchaeota archaeon]